MDAFIAGLQDFIATRILEFYCNKNIRILLQQEY